VRPRAARRDAVAASDSATTWVAAADRPGELFRRRRCRAGRTPSSRVSQPSTPLRPCFRHDPGLYRSATTSKRRRSLCCNRRDHTGACDRASFGSRDPESRNSVAGPAFTYAKKGAAAAATQLSAASEPAWRRDVLEAAWRLAPSQPASDIFHQHGQGRYWNRRALQAVPSVWIGRYRGR